MSLYIYVSIYMCVCLLCLPIDLFYLSIYRSSLRILYFLSIYVSLYLSICLYFYLCIYLPMLNLSMYLLFHLFIYLPICLFVHRQFPLLCAYVAYVLWLLSLLLYIYICIIQTWNYVVFFKKNLSNWVLYRCGKAKVSTCGLALQGPKFRANCVV